MTQVSCSVILNEAVGCFANGKCVVQIITWGPRCWMPWSGQWDSLQVFGSFSTVPNKYWGWDYFDICVFSQGFRVNFSGFYRESWDPGGYFKMWCFHFCLSLKNWSGQMLWPQHICIIGHFEEEDDGLLAGELLFLWLFSMVGLNFQIFNTIFMYLCM